MEKIGFVEDISHNTGKARYIHVDLDLEFLVKKKGSGEIELVMVDKLHVNAVALRYMNLLSNYTMKVKYNDVEITLPEPAAFVMQKFIISQRRPGSEKREKDLNTDINIGELIIRNKKHGKRFIEIYRDL